MNNNKDTRYVKSIFVGMFSGAIIFAILLTIVSKSYGLTLQEYKAITQFKEMTKEYYYEDTNNVNFEEGIKKGIVESLNDPYSKYLNKEEFKKMIEDTTGNFVGIGVYIAPTEDDTIVVISPIKDSPAQKAGIKSGDIISTVDGKKYEAKTMQEAVKAMRGEEGKNVKVGIISNGKYKEYDIKREPIHPQTVDSKVLENNIGYIQIVSFEEKTAQEFRKNYSELKAKNIKSLIIDVRSNPGGLVDQVVDIADQILPESTIVYTNNKKNKKQYYKATNKESIKLPMVILVDEGSASASEILSGALQDNKVATVVGKKTYGKGVIQSILNMKDGSGLVITTAQYYTPNGNVVHKKGIIPDVVVENKDKKDNQLKKAIEILKGKTNV